MRSSEGRDSGRRSGRPRGLLHINHRRHDVPCRMFSLTVASFFINWQEFSLILSTYKNNRIVCDMSLTVTKMTRVFQFNGIRLPDPNPEMSVDNVKALYSAQYPELTTAVVNGPEAVGDKLRYTFDRAIGSKG